MHRQWGRLDRHDGVTRGEAVREAEICTPLSPGHRLRLPEAAHASQESKQALLSEIIGHMHVDDPERASASSSGGSAALVAAAGIFEAHRAWSWRFGRTNPRSRRCQISVSPFSGRNTCPLNRIAFQITGHVHFYRVKTPECLQHSRYPNRGCGVGGPVRPPTKSPNCTNEVICPCSFPRNTAGSTATL